MTAPNLASVQPEDLTVQQLRRVVAAESAVDVLENIAELVRRARDARGLSLRVAAAEIGIGFNTLYRVERGGEARLRQVTAIVRWLSSPGVLP